MPALVDSSPCQDASAAPSTNQPRRVVPVVPVIPRKLEKKKPNEHVGKKSVGSTEGGSVTRLPRQPSSRRRGSSVVKDSSTKSENGEFERKSSLVEDKGKHSSVIFHS